MSSILLDSGAVSFLAGRSPRVVALLDELRALGDLVVPSVVLVECLTGQPTDAPTFRFLKGCSSIETVPVGLARDAARLRFQAGRGSAVDALVVALAQNAMVVTGDAEDFSALSAHARNVTVIAI